MIVYTFMANTGGTYLRERYSPDSRANLANKSQTEALAADIYPL